MGFQKTAIPRRPSILPDYGIIYRLAAPCIPNYDSLSLVSDTQGLYVLRPDLMQDLAKDLILGLPDLLRIVFDPAVFRKYLSKLLLTIGYLYSPVIEGYGTGTAGSLVKCDNYFFHIP